MIVKEGSRQYKANLDDIDDGSDSNSDDAVNHIADNDLDDER
jgi:hypothetical protein